MVGRADDPFLWGELRLPEAADDKHRHYTDDRPMMNIGATLQA